MMFKKIFMLLTVSILALHLTACGKSAEEKRIEQEQKAAQEYREKRRQ